ncbi:alpha/beta hydrolase-fold protein [Corynebacterium sp. ES2775-CONJ]|uniref:alpha/beta hydrolase-fold protein n=1 Tax=Corynebacterium sp. ES2775-CONJ TaxID=2974029 RepID=UPI00216A07A8|nr:alpha/beta hydrolase-fold protein [Corynebacterium sp. ES2775-CONJ]MCS4489639.1 alpha/beta hydrolase-fold protein [Corynebacterium sp. ES2775-CONJ]
MFYRDAEIIDACATMNNPAHFLSQLLTQGTPLHHPTGIEMTFLVDLCELDPAYGVSPPDDVHVWINRLTDKTRHAHGLMRQVPGTSVWVRTLTIPPTVRASYCFRINAGHYRPPGHNNYPHFFDPHARFGHLISEGRKGLSLIRGRSAPPHRIWDALTHPHPARFDCSPEGIYSYFPAIPCADLPLLILLDADIWFQRLHLEVALDQAIAHGMIPPVAVIGLGFSSPDKRRQMLTVNPETSHYIASQLPLMAQQLAKTRGHRLSSAKPLIAGQSLGAFQALYIALNCADLFGAVIAQSPSLWWHPGPEASPRDLNNQVLPWLVTELYELSIPQRLPHFYISTGLREDQLLPHVMSLITALDDLDWPHSFSLIDGGHDLAWWRETLFDDLSAALSEYPRAHLDPRAFSTTYPR